MYTYRRENESLSQKRKYVFQINSLTINQKNAN